MALILALTLIAPVGRLTPSLVSGPLVAAELKTAWVSVPWHIVLYPLYRANPNSIPSLLEPTPIRSHPYYSYSQSIGHDALSREKRGPQPRGLTYRRERSCRLVKTLFAIEKPVARAAGPIKYRSQQSLGLSLSVQVTAATEFTT